MDNFYIYKSSIHGDGVFCKKIIFPKEKLFLVMDKKENYLTDLAKKLNHSITPNTFLKPDEKNGNLYLYSLKSISPNAEITINYSNSYLFFQK